MRDDSATHVTQTGSGRRDDFCLIFMHLPKTAGTTLASSLQWNFPPHRTLHIDLLGMRLEEVERVPIEQRANLLLLHGHIAYGIHRFIPRPCRYVTLLREPIPRVVSAYKHALRTPHHELHDRLVDGKVGLEEFVETFWVDKRMSRQTRQLCDQHFGLLDREALDKAKRNLASFLVVGLTERFEESFALLRRAIPLSRPVFVTRNVGQQLQVSARAVELIREKERFDLELYEFARALFAEQLERQGRSLGLEASIYRTIRPLSRIAGAGRTHEFLRRLSHARAAWD